MNRCWFCMWHYTQMSKRKLTIRSERDFNWSHIENKTVIYTYTIQAHVFTSAIEFHICTSKRSMHTMTKKTRAVPIDRLLCIWVRVLRLLRVLANAFLLYMWIKFEYLYPFCVCDYYDWMLTHSIWIEYVCTVQ